MDQQKTTFPTEAPDDCLQTWRIVGTILHKTPQYRKVFLQDKKFFSDSNVTIQALLNVILPLGPRQTLWVQSDNTAKDQRNNTFLR